VELTQDHKRQLLTIARNAVDAEINGKPQRPATGNAPILDDERGCFVTLTNQGRLRGCIGVFTPRGPLRDMLVEMGKAAARDPRFVTRPVTPTELPDLTVEVSILSPLEKTPAPEQLEIGKHGIYVACGPRSGCFLPEVATDQGWSAEEFLSHCCAQKAGLPPGAWKHADCDVYFFTSEKFSEQDV
jgi:uncharacterized protein